MVTHFKRLILLIFVAASFAVAFAPQSVSAAPADNEPDCVKDNGTWVEGDNPHCEAGSPKSSCEIDGVGWVVCPALKFMGKLNDAAFGIINDFLEVQPALLADDGARVPWEQFRNIANIAFVITFVVIIYSQITGAGVTNYGIKKLLPKIVIAAILVNISYYLCQIAVDVSNIIGHSIYGFFKDIPTTNADGSTDFVDAAGNTLSWENVITGALAAAGIILVAVMLAMSMGSMALLAFVLVVVILLARKAIIILLIVVSPLAFVAYLLPNTEKWFKKWSQLFGNLLMVYPIIGVIFGASYLTARIISNTASGSGDDQTLLQLTALGISAVPLFAIPAVLKGGMAATGAIGAKLSGGLDRATGAMGKQRNERIKRRGENIESRMAASERTGRLGSAMRYAGGYRARRDFRHGEMEHETARNKQDALTQHVLTATNRDGESRYSDLAQARAFEQRDKAFHEDVSAASVLQKEMGFVERANIAMNGEDTKGNKVSEAQRVAAINHVMDNGNFSDRKSLLDTIGGMSKRELQATADGYYKAGMQGTLGAILGDQISQGGYKEEDGTEHKFADMSEAQIQSFMNSAVLKGIKDGKVKAETLVEDGDATQYIAEMAEAGVRNGLLTDEDIKVLKTAVQVVATSPALAAKRTQPVQEGLDRIERL